MHHNGGSLLRANIRAFSNLLYYRCLIENDITVWRGDDITFAGFLPLGDLNNFNASLPPPAHLRDVLLVRLLD